MNIAIIDAEIVGKKKHRFPNLACMKLSGWHKRAGNNVILKTDYDNLSEYDKVFISRVFTKTVVPYDVLGLRNVHFGGTGFYHDKSPPLPPEIEHSKPDYHLYNDWVADRVSLGAKEKEFAYYKDYSIGFTTRGCHKKCAFCVNRDSDKSVAHSPVLEFLDASRKKICLLDDNFLACPSWKNILLELQSTGKPFQFKQGLDGRLFTNEKCGLLFRSKYDGEYIFAFDNVEERELIENQIIRLRRYTNKIPKFYVLCGFDRNNRWDDEFWLNDIEGVFLRVEILGRYRCLPYIMRYDRYEESPFRKIYVDLARWINQPAFFKKVSFMEFCLKHKENSGTVRFVKEFLKMHPKFIKPFNERGFVNN